MSCRGSHWFAYPRQTGTSSPTCTRHGCEAPNPAYDRDRDPYAVEGADVDELRQS